MNKYIFVATGNTDSGWTAAYTNLRDLIKDLYKSKAQIMNNQCWDGVQIYKIQLNKIEFPFSTIIYLDEEYQDSMDRVKELLAEG